MNARSVAAATLLLLVWASPPTGVAAYAPAPEPREMYVLLANDVLAWSPPTSDADELAETSYKVYGLLEDGRTKLLAKVPPLTVSYLVPEGYVGYGVAPMRQGTTGAISDACWTISPHRLDVGSCLGSVSLP